MIRPVGRTTGQNQLQTKRWRLQRELAAISDPSHQIQLQVLVVVINIYGVEEKNGWLFGIKKIVEAFFTIVSSYSSIVVFLQRIYTDFFCHGWHG